MEVRAMTQPWVSIDARSLPSERFRENLRPRAHIKRYMLDYTGLCVLELHVGCLGNTSQCLGSLPSTSGTSSSESVTPRGSTQNKPHSDINSTFMWYIMYSVAKLLESGAIVMVLLCHSSECGCFVCFA